MIITNHARNARVAALPDKVATTILLMGMQSEADHDATVATLCGTA